MHPVGMPGAMQSCGENGQATDIATTEPVKVSQPPAKASKNANNKDSFRDEPNTHKSVSSRPNTCQSIPLFHVREVPAATAPTAATSGAYVGVWGGLHQAYCAVNRAGEGL